jgi:hypothetical protein
MMVLLMFIISIEFSLVDYLMQTKLFIELAKTFILRMVINRLVMVRLVQELVYYQIKMALNSIRQEIKTIIMQVMRKGKFCRC